MVGPDRPRRGKGGSLADNSPRPKSSSTVNNSAAQSDDKDDDSTLSNAIQTAIDKLLTDEKFISKLVSAIKTKLLDEICESLRSEVKASLKLDIDNANDNMALLEKRVDLVEETMDEAEQYSRRNCLIFAGINETQDENVEETIMNICKDDLDVTVEKGDIDRCHRLGNVNYKGKKTRKQHRDIIVKFTNYRKRDSVYKARFSLRKTSSKSKSIFINESLTQHRNKLYWKVKRGLESKDYKLWTQDGKIIVKKPNGEKVVYFTVPFPYILLTILLIRAVTLPNAIEGIIFYLKPDLTKLRSSQVWLDAATQIFFSNSLGQGVLVALGSYNKKTHNFVRDTLLYSAINSATSLYAGFVIFAVLGFMSGVQGKAVGDVASSGPGLGFIAYPEAITQTPLSTLWAILFFLTLLFLGIDSQFVCVEGFITTVVDLYPKTLLRGYRREMFCAAVCAVYCILAIPVVTNGGMYIFQLFDYYSCSGFVLLWIAIFESIVIGWVYGGRRFMRNVAAMTGMGWITRYMVFSWMFATPLFAGTIFLYSLVSYQPLTYEDEYIYPWWGYAIGIMMAVASMVNIPIFIIYQLIFKSQGSLKQRCIALTTPSIPDYETPMDKKEVELLEFRVR